ncbi:hypothetical protein LX32DRAFT_21363 [Colletotrichum zoysiae]|uniref:Uncharacterized protein n=1 Tax=Colletotrichum zoysiae TaxID=1216348 RepID=A0AAD9M2G7_9PEZI|nr:hypothetical protein LX32DRAFT_21363 [Colletotrichum zoysiae]
MANLQTAQRTGFPFQARMCVALAWALQAHEPSLSTPPPPSSTDDSPCANVRLRLTPTYTGLLPSTLHTCCCPLAAATRYSIHRTRYGYSTAVCCRETRPPVESWLAGWLAGWPCSLSPPHPDHLSNSAHPGSRDPCFTSVGRGAAAFQSCSPPHLR